MEQVTDTLLHELSHIIWGPHDNNFHNLWNELRDEHQSLIAKGYSGEGFLSQGQKLGGKRIPLDEMRRQARIAAEKRKATSNQNGGGRRLGGQGISRGIDMRKVIADAAKRRNSITEGCASGSAQAPDLINQQAREGFRTKAEETDANDLAIAEALQDLMEEEELLRLEELCAPNGGGGLAWDPVNGLQFDNDPPSRSSTPGDIPPASGILPSNSRRRPLSRLLGKDANNSSKPKSTAPIRQPSRLISAEEERARNKNLPPSPPPESPPPPANPTNPDEWACPQCTLHNPLGYLSCEACGLEQPPQPIPPNQRYGPANHPAALPKPPPATELRGQGVTPFEPAKGRIGWNCLNCGTFMENQVKLPFDKSKKKTNGEAVVDLFALRDDETGFITVQAGKGSGRPWLFEKRKAYEVTIDYGTGGILVRAYSAGSGEMTRIIVGLLNKTRSNSKTAWGSSMRHYVPRPFWMSFAVYDVTPPILSLSKAWVQDAFVEVRHQAGLVQGTMY